MALYNRPKSYEIAVARENARGSQDGAQAKAEEVAYQAADLFLTASQMEHQSEILSGQLPSLQKVVQSTAAGVTEGSELPLELKRARVNLALSEQRRTAARLDADYYEMMLSVVLGYQPTDRVKPIASELPSLSSPPSEDEAADAAMRNNKELRQMQSNVLAKQLELRSYKAARLPQVDLVAQYSLFAKHNYEQYFQKFQRNSAQLGASITIPILVGTATKGLAAQAFTDMQKIRIQMDQVRNRILTDTRRTYEQWQKAQSIRELSRMQLDLAREELTVLLAQNGEGRVSLNRVEQARVEEADRWLSFYDSGLQELRARLAILRQTGNLLASVRAGQPAGTSESNPVAEPRREP